MKHRLILTIFVILVAFSAIISSCVRQEPKVSNADATATSAAAEFHVQLTLVATMDVGERVFVEKEAAREALADKYAEKMNEIPIDMAEQFKEATQTVLMDEIQHEWRSTESAIDRNYEH